MPFSEKQQFQDMIEDKIAAYIIRKERVNQNLSLRALAEYSNMTPQFLSDIEHSKKKPSEFVFHQIQVALDIVIHEEDTYMTDCKEYNNRLYKYYIMLKRDTLTTEYKNMISKKNIFLYSYGLPYFLLASLIYFISNDPTNNSIYELINELEQLKFAIEKRDLVKFYDICGYFYTLRGKNKLAKANFEEAFELSSIQYKYENALLYSHASLFYIMTNQLWDALEMCLESIKLLSDLCIFKRVIINQRKKANLYVSMGFYDKAISQFNHLIEKAELSNEQQASIYGNLANCYIQNKNYTKAAYCCQKAQEMGSKFSTTYFDFAFILWKQNNDNECLNYIELHKKNEHLCNSDRILMKILKHHILGEKDTVYSLLNKVLEKPEKDSLFNSINTIQFSLNFAIDIFKSYKDYEKVVSLYEERDRVIQSHNIKTLIK